MACIHGNKGEEGEEGGEGEEGEEEVTAAATTATSLGAGIDSLDDDSGALAAVSSSLSSFIDNHIQRASRLLLYSGARIARGGQWTRLRCLRMGRARQRSLDEVVSCCLSHRGPLMDINLWVHLSFLFRRAARPLYLVSRQIKPAICDLDSQSASAYDICDTPARKAL